jgi:hypothetical protein
MYSKRRIAQAAVNVVVIGLCGAQAEATTFTTPQIAEGSNATITQIADISSGTLQTSVTVPALPTTAPKTYQLNDSVLTEGKASSTANAGVYAVTGDNNLGIGLTTGTGITQVNTADPDQTFGDAANLDIAVNANWVLPSGYPETGSFPMLAYQFALGGTMGKNGYAEFAVNLDVSDSATGFLSNIYFDNVYYNGEGAEEAPGTVTSAMVLSPGKFTAPVISGVDFLDPFTGAELPPDSILTISGTIDFFAYDDPACGTTLQVVDDLNSDSAVPLPPPARMSGVALLLLACATGWRRIRKAP